MYVFILFLNLYYCFINYDEKTCIFVRGDAMRTRSNGKRCLDCKFRPSYLANGQIKSCIDNLWRFQFFNARHKTLIMSPRVDHTVPYIYVCIYIYIHLLFHSLRAIFKKVLLALDNKLDKRTWARFNTAIFQARA